MTKQVTIKISKEVVDRINSYLLMNTTLEGTKGCAVIETLTANFGLGIEADIKVCNGDSGPWIDAVLFENGHEIMILEPYHENIVSEYVFGVANDTYIVIIEEE